MKKKFKFFITLILFGLSVSKVYATDSTAVNKQNREVFVKRHAINTSNRLDIDSDKRSRFINIYSNYLNDLFDASVTNRSNKNAKMTEEDYKRINEQSIDQAQKVANIRNKYYAKFKNILTQKQIYRLRQIEKRDLSRLQSIDRQHKNKEKSLKRQSKARKDAEGCRHKAKQRAEARQKQNNENNNLQ